jgi:hypothetical protein
MDTSHLEEPSGAYTAFTEPPNGKIYSSKGFQGNFTLSTDSSAPETPGTPTQSKPITTDLTTMNTFHPEESSGAVEASADLRNKGTNSGSEEDHILTSEPFGSAGDLSQAAGHGA